MKNTRKRIAALLAIAAVSGLSGAAAQADVTFSTNSVYDAASHRNQNLNIIGGSTLTFEDTATRTESGSAINVILGDAAVEGDTGNLVFNMTTVPESVTHGADYAFSNGGTVTIKGTGNITLKGGGHIASISQEGGKVTYALNAGSLINIEEGVWVNGGWMHHDWTQNKSDLNIAAGATLNMWDASAIYVDKLTGEGTIGANQAGIRGPLVVGVNNGSSTFDGSITQYTTLQKKGTGTLTLTKANTNTGTTQSHETGAELVDLLSHSFVISEGAVKLTDAGTLGTGKVRIDEGAKLEIANSYAFSNPLYGTGTVEWTTAADFRPFNSTHAKSFENFEGTLKISSNNFYFETNDLSENVTISLNGGIIRNCNNSYTLKNPVIIDSASGGVKPGWGGKSLTLAGKISDGAADTLNIVADSNTGNSASWVVLTNPENDYSNTIVDHYLRVTATGALGTGTVTVNSGKTLDLTSTEFAASRLANSGTVTSSSTGDPAILTMDAAVGGTVSGNIQMIVPNGTDFTNANYSHTGGTIFRNTSGDVNYVHYGSSLGKGTVTLENGIIMNQTYSLAIPQDIEIKGTDVSIRGGYASQPNSVGLTGNISGTGKLTFNKGESGPVPIYLSGTNTYSGGTAFGNTGGTNRMILDSNDAFGTGTVDISGKSVAFTFNTGGTWGRTLYHGAFNTADPHSISQYRLDMDDTANTQNSSSWGTNRTYGYSTVIQAEEDVTLEFGKHFDDSIAIFVTDLNTGTKTTVMNKSGGWTDKTFADFTFQKDTPYLIDIRLGQGTGSAGVAYRNNGTDPDIFGLNDDPNDLVGCGVRVKDSGSKFYRLTVAGNGDWAFADGSIKTAAQDRELKNDLNIGTQTVQVENAGMGNATVSGKIIGAGTLAFSSTSLLDADTNGLSIFNGAPNSDADKFNVTVAANTNFTGNGTIGGNLTMAADSALVLDQTQDLGALTVNGKLTAQNITLDAMLEDPSSLFAVSADSADLTGSTLNLAYVGDLDLLYSVPTFTLIETKNGITGFDTLNVSFDALGQDIVFAGAFLENGNLLVSFGNSNSVPEPSTWVLLLSAMAGIGFLRRKK